VGIDYPELVVFDLDACFWDQEMYQMSALPDKTVIGDLNGKYDTRYTMLIPHHCLGRNSTGLTQPLFASEFLIYISIVGQGDGVTGAYSGRNKISMHKGSLIALQEHAMGMYPGMKLCFASSADTPFAEKVGRATLKLLEVVPGMPVWDLVLKDWDNQDVNQIGRQPPLSR
jgi:magnesium-dependent phosphatase 1